MKTYVFLICLLLFCATTVAQEGFYVKIKQIDALPNSITLKEDSTSLELKFSNKEIEETFKNYTITNFERVFETSKRPSLADLYLIETPDIEIVDELRQKF